MSHKPRFLGQHSLSILCWVSILQSVSIVAVLKLTFSHVASSSTSVSIQFEDVHSTLKRRL